MRLVLSPALGKLLSPLLPLIRGWVSLPAALGAVGFQREVGKRSQPDPPLLGSVISNRKILPFPKLLSLNPAGFTRVAGWQSSPARHPPPALPGKSRPLTWVPRPAPRPWGPKATPGTSGAKKWISSSRSSDSPSIWATSGGSLTSATKTEGVRTPLGLFKSSFGEKKSVFHLSSAEKLAVSFLSLSLAAPLCTGRFRD